MLVCLTIERLHSSLVVKLRSRAARGGHVNLVCPVDLNWMLDILVLFMLYHDLIQRNTLRKLLTELTLSTLFLFLLLTHYFLKNSFPFLSLKLSPNKTRLWRYKTNWVALRSHAAWLRPTVATLHSPHISDTLDWWTEGVQSVGNWAEIRGFLVQGPVQTKGGKCSGGRGRCQNTFSTLPRYAWARLMNLALLIQGPVMKWGLIPGWTYLCLLWSARWPQRDQAVEKTRPWDQLTE